MMEGLLTALNGDKAKLLSDAFGIFREASEKLEQQYSMLKRQVEDLNCELSEKNKALERSRRLAAMGEMAAKIAHEIRNPLGSMAIFASLLERELESNQESKRLAGHITKGIKTLDNMLSNMLLFSGAPEARRRPIDIREAVEDALVLSGAHERKGVRLELVYTGETRMDGDLGLLGQLFLNLFLNAFDAMPGGGSLTVRAGLDDAGLMAIAVSDTGGGIPDEHMDRVFDPFFSTKDRGTGLGLAIVSAVVIAHRGAVEAESSNGVGTTFLIKLPAKGGN